MARPIVSFSKLKQSFYSRVSDLSVFDCGNINLLKVVLDGIKVDYAGKGNIRVVLLSSKYFIRFFLWLERMRKGSEVHALRESWRAVTPELLSRPTMLIEPSGRVFQRDGKDHSFYGDRIVAHLGRNQIFIVTEGSKKQDYGSSLCLPSYSLTLLAAIGLTADFFSLQSKVRTTYKKIVALNVFSELELKNIQIGLQQFLIQFACWNALLKNSSAGNALVWPHYHREGCILALKRKGITVTELQHGLIAIEDVFYGFPERVHAITTDMLFADRILVYGEFWKQQVIKGNSYTESRIVIGGYSPYVPEIAAAQILKYKEIFLGKKIILVTTQTFLDDFFTAYITFLSKDLVSKKLDYCILVKLHPAEKEELYASIRGLENVRIVNDFIDVLMSAADLHVSVYSTTMFDALRFGVTNYSVYHPELADYIEMYVREGISTVIQPDENPLDKLEEVSSLRKASWYFSEFNPAAIL